MPRATSGPERLPHPEGTHHVVLVDVVDLGMRTQVWSGKQQEKWKVVLVFQSRVKHPDYDRWHDVGEVFTNTLGAKGKLRPFLESWMGRRLTKQELSAGMELDDFIGRNAMVQIIHDEDANGTVWANIRGIFPCPDGAPTLVPEGYVMQRDRNQDPNRSASGPGAPVAGGQHPPEQPPHPADAGKGGDDDGDDLPF